MDGNLREEERTARSKLFRSWTKFLTQPDTCNTYSLVNTLTSDKIVPSHIESNNQENFSDCWKYLPMITKTTHPRMRFSTNSNKFLYEKQKLNLLYNVWRIGWEKFCEREHNDFEEISASAGSWIYDHTLLIVFLACCWSPIFWNIDDNEIAIVIFISYVWCLYPITNCFSYVKCIGIIHIPTYLYFYVSYILWWYCLVFHIIFNMNSALPFLMSLNL